MNNFAAVIHLWHSLRFLCAHELYMHVNNNNIFFYVNFQVSPADFLNLTHHGKPTLSCRWHLHSS